MSEAGRIAKQMLESLGGFWGLHLFDDVNSIQFINKLANSARVKRKAENGEFVEEEFLGRAANIEQWEAMIAKRIEGGAHHRVGLSNYIDKNAIRAGLETSCTHCSAKNWHGLDEVSYKVKCSRCLKTYDFPQGNLKKHNKNWKYRVVGPFAVPNYAQGAYASLLTIRFFSQFFMRDNSSSYSTAIDIVTSKENCEVDFAIWLSDEAGHDIQGEPRLVIGEAKSFAIDAVREKDITQLKLVAGLMPESVLVISVLKTEFSDAEIQLLKEFVEWTRESDNYQPRHWVILLTGTELFTEFLTNTWKEMGEPYSRFADYHYTSYFESLSDATLEIYLGLPSYYQYRESQRKGVAKKLKKKRKISGAKKKGATPKKKRNAPKKKRATSK